MVTLLDGALDLAGRGWPVFPCEPRGKRPITDHGVKDATTDTAQIEAWWSRTPDANIGLACGDAVVVVDFDGDEWPDVPETLVVRTGRGRHIYLDPEGQRYGNRARLGGRAIDVRGAGGYVIAPPSVHPSGAVYQWEGAAALAPVPSSWASVMLTTMPAAVPPPRLDHTPSRMDARERASRWLAQAEPAVSGQGGHGRTLAVAVALARGFDLGPDGAYELMAAEYNGRCQPPWSAKDLKRKCDEAWRVGAMEIGEKLRDRDDFRPRLRVVQDEPPAWLDAPPPDDDWQVVPETGLTPFAAALLERVSRVKAHWQGRGKANGDQSARGYDIAVALDVFVAGGNEDDARSAVLSRPDGHAASMAPAYLADVLRAAISAKPPDREARKEAAAAERLREAIGIVSRVVLYRTDPPTYELTVGGVTFDTTAAVLVNRGRMMTRIVEATNTIPDLPKKGYGQWVAAVLAAAEIVEMPDDASEAGGIVAELSYMLEGMPPGEDIDDLERGCVYINDRGELHILLRAFAHSVAAAMPKLTRPTLCKMLRVLGWSDTQIRLGGDQKQIRVWRKGCDET